MVKSIPTPITKDNFDQAQAFIADKLAMVRAKKRIRKIVKPVSSLLFAFLSLLLVYGAIYRACGPEELVVIERFSFLTKAWHTFADLFTSADMAWYVYWPVLIVATLVLPLVFSAIVTIIVLALRKAGAKTIGEGTDAEKAKQLHDDACALSAASTSRDSRTVKTVFKLIFTLSLVAFIVYAFITLKLGFSISMLIGFALAAAIVYFVYGWVFSAFYALNGLFYKIRSIPSLVDATDSYWLSVDTVEAERRRAEAKRQEEEARKRKAQEERAAHTVSTVSASSIDWRDSFTWTREYVRSNENRCSEVALNWLSVSKECLSEGDYSGAALGFDKVVRALELLKTVDSDYYLSPLFVNCYALGQIFAFGLNNKSKACEYVKKACDYAAECHSDTARRDLRIMRDFYDALVATSSLSRLTEEFDINFPYDILRMN